MGPASDPDRPKVDHGCTAVATPEPPRIDPVAPSRDGPDAPTLPSSSSSPTAHRLRRSRVVVHGPRGGGQKPKRRCRPGLGHRPGCAGSGCGTGGRNPSSPDWLATPTSGRRPNGKHHAGKGVFSSESGTGAPVFGRSLERSVSGRPPSVVPSAADPPRLTQPIMPVVAVCRTACRKALRIRPLTPTTGHAAVAGSPASEVSASSHSFSLVLLSGRHVPDNWKSADLWAPPIGGRCTTFVESTHPGTPRPACYDADWKGPLVARNRYQHSIIAHQSKSRSSGLTGQRG